VAALGDAPEKLELSETPVVKERVTDHILDDGELFGDDLWCNDCRREKDMCNC
jgi:hypothetical protein